MTRTETQTCPELIDSQLAHSGWNVWMMDKNLIIGVGANATGPTRHYRLAEL